MARIRKNRLCSTISLRRTLRSPKSRVTRLGDRMGAGTLRDCVRVTGLPVVYDFTLTGARWLVAGGYRCESTKRESMETTTLWGNCDVAGCRSFAVKWKVLPSPGILF